MADRISPELDLLEACSDEDVSFHEALLGFCGDDPFNASNVQRVQRVIAIYAREGLVVINRDYQGRKVATKSWEARSILENAAAWVESPDDEHRFSVSTTSSGWDAFVERSQIFFDNLFGQR